MTTALWRRALPVVMVAIPTIVAIVVVAVQTDPDVVPGGDMASLELGVREALAGRRLLGPYSRFGFHHPGPVYFYLQVIPYVLLGSVSGLQAGALAINGIAAACTVVVLQRVAGERAGWGSALALLSFGVAVGPATLRDPWNPFVVVLPLVLFGVLCAIAVSGRPAHLWGALVVGSACVQTSIATAPYVAVLVAVCLVVAVRRGWWRDLFHGRTAAIGAIAVVLLWLPPLIEQFLFRGGNIGHIARFLLSGQGGRDAASATAAYVEAVATLPLGRPTRDVAATPQLVPAAVAVAVLTMSAGCWLVARARRSPLPSALGALATIGMLVTYPLTFLIADPMAGYLVYWMVAAPMLAWVAVAMAIVRRVPATAALNVVAVLALSLSMLRLGPPSEKHDPRTAGPAAEAIAAADAAGAQRVLLRVPDDLDWPIALGVGLALDRAGYDFRVTDDWLLYFGENHRSTGEESLVLTVSDEGTRPSAPP